MFKRNLYTWKHSLKNLLPWDPLFSSSLAASWLAGQCESVPQVFTECGSLSLSPDPKLLFTWPRAKGSGNESSLPAVSPTHSGTFLPKCKSPDIPSLQFFLGLPVAAEGNPLQWQPKPFTSWTPNTCPSSIQKFYFLAEISSPCTSPTPNHLSSSNCGSLFQVPGTSGKVSLLFSLSSDWLTQIHSGWYPIINIFFTFPGDSNVQANVKNDWSALCPSPFIFASVSLQSTSPSSLLPHKLNQSTAGTRPMDIYNGPFTCQAFASSHLTSSFSSFLSAQHLT